MLPGRVDLERCAVRDRWRGRGAVVSLETEDTAIGGEELALLHEAGMTCAACYSELN